MSGGILLLLVKCWISGQTLICALTCVSPACVALFISDNTLQCRCVLELICLARSVVVNED